MEVLRLSVPWLPTDAMEILPYKHCESNNNSCVVFFTIYQMLQKRMHVNVKLTQLYTQ